MSTKVNGRKYKNPPVVEVIIECQFSDDSPWAPAWPSEIHQALRAEFPEQRMTRQLQMTISAGPDQVGHAVRPVERIQFLKEDRSALIQVGPQFFSFNHLTPYRGWARLVPMAQGAFSAYGRICEPRRIKTLALRYLNRIRLRDQSAQLAEYLNFYPSGPDELQPCQSFTCGIQVLHRDNRDALQVELNSVVEPELEASGAILGIHYLLLQPDQVGADEVFSWLEEAHGRAVQAFEACITDKLRDTFEPTG